MKQLNSINIIQESVSDKLWKAVGNNLKNLQEEHQVGTLTHVVTEIIGKTEQFKKIAEEHHTPCYVFDKKNLIDAINNYVDAFSIIADTTHFYAVKLNHEPTILKTIFSYGFGADVSSARELFLAKEAGATKFLFSGPGKTYQELQKALTSDVDIIINIDSFSELERIVTVCKDLGIKQCKCGVRVTFNEHGAWDKFGIPLTKLCEFFQRASQYPSVHLSGIQFHMSWNETGASFTTAIAQLADKLSSSEMKNFLPQIDFIDFGGGFRPYQSEGYFAEDTAVGSILKGIAELTNEEPSFKNPYYILKSVPIDQYAKDIQTAIDKNLRSLKNFTYFSEPGRIIVNQALHVMVSVVDIKSDKCVITDGGTNIVGFERFEFDYFPVINISNPSLEEKECMVYGSLCMPQDYWGQRIFASEIKEGDLIVIPYQGALTYSNMNDFIKGKALVFNLPYENS